MTGVLESDRLVAVNQLFHFVDDVAHPLRGGAVGALIHLLLHGFGNLLHHGATNGATSLINNRGVFLATLHLNILVGIGLVAESS